MAATWFLVLILMAASSATSSSSSTTDLARAIEEMQRANYFTFVVLIHLAPPHLIQGNLTFLMPNDKTLSGNFVRRQTSIADFLLRHSIPSPLLFEHLEHFPTGSILPTSKPGLFLNITNGGGRRRFFLNNVRITSPNICTRGSSIRCHGIDGVIQPLQLPATPGSNVPPPPPPPPSPMVVPEAPPPAIASQPVISFNPSPSTAPPPSDSNHHRRKSGSRPQLMMKWYLTCLMLLAVKLSI